ncbi:MAG: hypothetical protein CVV35_02695 [Methanomicrobiales archaeon HGW-Methanomicrobiales-6]|nr:hypothetical protein EI28_04880 [Methanoculleus sp. MH98A]KDE54667.1 hypothetical protein EI28_12640 [Methanoculleus sp. MH98A]PKL56880.1 MAG: hypothetical protein CVV35_02695 [Methanomicrobiales archaeon HGW-Methanomicrobiales-6]
MDNDLVALEELNTRYSLYIDRPDDCHSMRDSIAIRTKLRRYVMYREFELRILWIFRIRYVIYRQAS